MLLNYRLNISSVTYLVLIYLDTVYNNLNKYSLLVIDIKYTLLVIDIGLPIIYMLIILSIECDKRNICLLFCKALNNL